ncbi:siroheme synthase CysG [Sulfitobacter donghicola]|uniref:Siroheme synthase n=1 Tax=Sulfitobacter donghicola DSW-25 = KCTC 12864 = JCM 14565 TaxID=1300350 RepID=A0A073IGL9_9RHOB|nr:siroheme synthase CysG [Sulfitobacter donghicola]KEJ88700.1 siroheme synthase [Sulfitobacter donghicola DSW-25 = KCTC 12864 = JCM 14565]KIN68474.1 Uroporphyrin-III C-methyltransferase domain protein [Sulfitobacter donghicola DSW-25 = KCTC 12864 = JCM 14565]
MKTFPMFLQMQGRRVVIAGGGEQAAQKCRLILKTEAEITVLAPSLEPELADLHKQGKLNWQAGPICAADFSNAALVFIATGCPATDASLHSLAKTAGATVNVVDQPQLCDALTPSIVDRSPVVVAIGTEGTAPVLARQIKTRLEEALEPRLGDLAALAGRLRDRAAMRLGPRARRDLWRWVFAGPAREAHARGSERQAAQMIKQAIDTGEIGTDQQGAVALVGAGPGSKDLITLRGVQRLQEADIIFYDRLIDPEILDLARRDAERVYVGKAPGCHHWPQDKISGVLVAAARQGKRVVRLKCGDPGVFARGSEEADALNAAGIEYEIVPGVTAASAASASLGGFLTERGTCDTLVLSTGYSESQTANLDWINALRPGTRVAIYMGVGSAAKIADALVAAGLEDVISIDIVSRAQQKDQVISRCDASSLVETIQSDAILNPAILFLTWPQNVTKADATTDKPLLGQLGGATA